MSRIIVKNLPDEITKEKLKQIFGEMGVVTDVQLKYTKNGIFRKFAFIGFQKPEMAETAKQYLDKSFINTSKIQIETCAELGDPNKPRSWSKYSLENCEKIREKLERAKNKKAKMVKIKNQKIKDCQVLELLKVHKNDKLFTEFMEVNMEELPSELKVNTEEMNHEEEKGNEIDIDEEEKTEDDKNLLANKNISDSEYIKLKTGVELNLKDSNRNLNNKTTKYQDLFTVKLSGLPLKVKKSQIKEFLSPIKPYTIRRALKIRGVAYCGFLTEKEMKDAVFKNRSFLNNKRIFVVPVKAKKSEANKEVEEKWKSESERLKNSESIAESGKMFVRNLPYTATEDDLKEQFESFGPIVDFSMPIDSFTRKPKGFAFVTFLMPEHACKAFNELDGTIFQGRMLHLLPLISKKNTEEEEDTSDDTFKKKKLQKEKEKSSSSLNWNTYFIGENALAESMAATYNTSKENVLSDKQGSAAVRLALGETQLINKIKQFLEENEVCLEAFENMSICPRSKTVILVKNLPFGTKPEEIREKFAPFGVLKRVVLPPTGVAALIEFIEPSEAKVAFRRVSYSKFKHVPMYLEWAPEKIFNDKNKSGVKKDDTEHMDTTGLQESATESSTEPAESAANVETVHIPVEGATVFVKNLNFSTGKEALLQHFSSCGTVVSANIAEKKNPKDPGKKLSMGYGFVQFADKESADKALKTLQFSSLDNHRIELKRSDRTLAHSTLSGRKISANVGKPSTKILVRNVPFQATPKEISDLFKVFGEIKAVRMPKKMVGTGSHRGFCFIEFNTVQEAKRAFAALSQSTHLYGRRLVLEWAAAEDNVATLREKTAQQFHTGTAGIVQKTKITIEEDSEEE